MHFFGIGFVLVLAFFWIELNIKVKCRSMPWEHSFVRDSGFIEDLDVVPSSSYQKSRVCPDSVALYPKATRQDTATCAGHPWLTEITIAEDWEEAENQSKESKGTGGRQENRGRCILSLSIHQPKISRYWICEIPTYLFISAVSSYYWSFIW